MNAVCAECGHSGPAGIEVAPYDYGGKGKKRNTRWLCVPDLRDCEAKRRAKFLAWLAEQK